MGCRKVGMQDRWDLGHWIGFKTGRRQEKRDSGLEGFRTGGIHKKRDTSKERFRT